MAPNQQGSPPATAPPARSHHPSLRHNYSKDELLHFLRIMHDHMPIGGNEWDIVLKQHSLSYPGREVESLRCKFAQLHRVKTPTEDPRCPQEVKRAKRIKYIISSCADIRDGTEEMDLATGTFTNVTPTEEAEDKDASSLEGDNAAEGEAEELGR
jgi:hypothetical protein